MGVVRRRLPWSPEEDVRGAQLLRSGLTCREVGARLGRRKEVVSRRNRDLWKVPRIERPWLNERFFDEWNPLSAYVVGFIMADGCLKRDGQWVSIVQKERGILEEIGRAIGHRGPIYQESRGYYSLQFRSRHAWQRLCEIGLMPAKSMVIRMPDAPRELLSHLVRGYFDGDGAVYVRDLGKKPLLNASIATGSDVFRCQLCHSLFEELGIVPSVQGIELRVQSHRDCKRFYLWLYAGKEKSLYLARKYERFRWALDARSAWDLERSESRA